MTDTGVRVRSIGRVALIGNFPPRLCGIATFTEDVHRALAAAFPETAIDVYAMNDPHADHVYGTQVTMAIGQNELADYQAAARRIKGRRWLSRSRRVSSARRS